nr:unnamed protein product [Digitaria exilis]
MEAAVVSVSHGALGSLLGKLGDLLTARYKLLKEAKGQVMFLKAELESMQAFMKKISDAEEPDEQDKCWAKEVRELSYDIEDSVSEFMLCVERDSSRPRGFKEFISRSTKLLTTMNIRHQIAKEFEGLKIRVKEVSERHTRYKMDDVAPKENNTTIDLCTIDLRLLALHAETASLVGVKGPRDQLIQLMDEEGAAANQLKVLSIVGFGGLGKTTLANEIYRKLEEKFHCQAFISVSQKPNIRKILRTILSQVGFVAPKDVNIEMWEESELIIALKKFLLDMRYLIVIDDIWDASAWDIIGYALPENKNVPASFSHLESFHARFDPLFSRIPKWIVQLHSLNDLRLTIEVVEDADVGLLALLPSLVYLHLHIEGAPKDRILIRQGSGLFPVLKRFIFACRMISYLSFEAGAMPMLESLDLYFNAHGWDKHSAAPAGIEHLSGLKEIYVCIGGGRAKKCNKRAAESALRDAADLHPGVVRKPRAVVDFRGSKDKKANTPMEAAAVSVSHGAMGSLLGKLGELLTSKYKLLKEAKGQIMFLKAELESMYVFLKKISDTEETDEQDKCWAKEVRELSYDIEDRVSEFMLRVERDSGKPRGFKGFIKRTMKLLTTMNIRHEIAKEFEGLKIRVKEVSERHTRYLIVIDDIWDVSAWAIIRCALPENNNVPDSFIHLQSLHVNFWHSRVIPEWIGQLRSLYDLELVVQEVPEDGVGVLARLPSLIHLYLHIYGAPKDKIRIQGGSGLFPVLRHFMVGCSRISYLIFEAGAMPMLERLQLHFNAQEWDRHGAAPAGIEHLSGLKEICADIGDARAKESNIRAAESAVRDVADMHPGRPVANIKCIGTSYVFDGIDNEPDERKEDGDGGRQSST